MMGGPQCVQASSREDGEGARPWDYRAQDSGGYCYLSEVDHACLLEIMIVQLFFSYTLFLRWLESIA